MRCGTLACICMYVCMSEGNKGNWCRGNCEVKDQRSEI